jgi:hypothetical protein
MRTIDWRANADDPSGKISPSSSVPYGKLGLRPSCGGMPEFPRYQSPSRVESERFRRFDYDELIKRDKVNLDMSPWLKDDSLDDPDLLPIGFKFRMTERNVIWKRQRPLPPAKLASKHLSSFCELNYPIVWRVVFNHVCRAR